MPTLNRYILQNYQVPSRRPQYAIRGPICLVGDAWPGLVESLQALGHSIKTYAWDDADSPPAQLGGLILVSRHEGQFEQPLAALRWLQTVGSALRSHRGILRLLNQTDGNAIGHALGGMIKTAHHEWPEVSCRVLTVASCNCSDDVVYELLLEGPLETKLANGRITGTRLAQSVQTPAPGPLPFRRGGLVVVTGGARGVTAAAALALAKAMQPSLLILGRSPLPITEPEWLAPLRDETAIKRAILDRAALPMTPKQVAAEYQRIISNREIRTNLAQFIQAGAEADYHCVDVRNTAAVRAAIETARQRFGEVVGIIHGSGVLADRLIADKTGEQFESVFSTKVLGLNAVLAATAIDPLEFVVLFSSSTARFGRTGQVDYAAANEFLNAVARNLQRERPRCRTVAINWGPWDGGMVTPGLRRLFASESVGLIQPEDGGRFMVAELANKDVPPEVLVLGPTPTQAVEFMLSAEKVPPLRDHVLNGNMVLPFALALQYLAEAAIRRLPDHHFVECRDLRVLHPVQIEPAGETRILIECDGQESAESQVAVAVRLSVDNRVCYRATIYLDNSPLVHRHLEAAADATADCYGTELFHGSAWHAISTVGFVNNAGIDVTACTAPLPWRWLRDGAVRTWHVDPLMVDCALQAIIVYTQRQLGLPSLPTAIGRLQLHDPYHSGAVQIRVQATQADPPMIRANVTITANDGRPVATIEDCEFVCLESLRSAFARNRLPVGASHDVL